jgi:hypothetical protein
MSVLLMDVNLLILVCILSVLPFAEANAIPNEYEVKSAFIYNFTKFIQWPDASFTNQDDPLKICVVGDKPELKHFQKLNHKIVRGRSLSIRTMLPTDATEDCHVVYFTQLDTDQIRTTLAAIQHRPILTIGDYKGFTHHMGIIEFRIDPKGRVRLLINLERAKRSNIKISAQLLEVASIVMSEEAL